MGFASSCATCIFEKKILRVRMDWLGKMSHSTHSKYFDYFLFISSPKLVSLIRVCQFKTFLWEVTCLFNGKIDVSGKYKLNSLWYWVWHCGNGD